MSCEFFLVHIVVMKGIRVKLLNYHQHTNIRCVASFVYE